MHLDDLLLKIGKCTSLDIYLCHEVKREELRMTVKGHMTKPKWRPLQSATLLTVFFMLSSFLKIQFLKSNFKQNADFKLNLLFI